MPKRKLTGKVISDKMNKTKVIAINWFKKHPRYQKFYKLTKKIKAHDETNQYHVGDEVIIEETRPLSRSKHWVIKMLIKKSQSPALAASSPDEGSNTLTLTETESIPSVTEIINDDSQKL